MNETSRKKVPHLRRSKAIRSEEHTSELQSQSNLVCRLLLEKKQTEITSLRSNDVRHACLRDIQLAADRYFLQHHSHLHLAGQVGIVEFVRVAQEFARHEFDI